MSSVTDTSTSVGLCSVWWDMACSTPDCLKPIDRVPTLTLLPQDSPTSLSLTKQHHCCLGRLLIFLLPAFPRLVNLICSVSSTDTKRSNRALKTSKAYSSVQQDVGA